MTAERVSLQGKEEEREKDPNYFGDKRAGVLADLIRITEVNGNNNPAMADGPFVLDSKLWYFRAFNNTRVSHTEPNWSFYKAIPPHEYVPLFNAKPYSNEEAVRFLTVFSDVTVIDESDEYRPGLEEYQSLIDSALKRALQLNEQEKAGA